MFGFEYLVALSLAAPPAVSEWDDAEAPGEPAAVAEGPPAPLSHPPVSGMVTVEEMDWRMRRRSLGTGMGISLGLLLIGSGMLTATLIVMNQPSDGCGSDACDVGGTGLLIAGGTMAAAGGLGSLITIPMYVSNQRNPPAELALGLGRLGMRF